MKAITHRHRILLALMAADALGAATELQSPAQVARRFPEGLTSYAPGSPFGFLPGESTDDSQMTLATLCGLRQGTQDAAEVLLHYLDWLDHGPPDVGALTRLALDLAREGAGTRAGLRAWMKGGMENAGNGGLMRVAGVYLAGLTAGALLDMAVSVTALTHADPRCLVASVFMVALLEQLDRCGLPYTQAVEVAWEHTTAVNIVGTLEAHHGFDNELMPPDRYHQLLQGATVEVEARVEAGLAGIPIAQTGYVPNTLQAALALHHTAASWIEVAEGAALAGNDADTVGCIAGAIAGARGFEVPKHLVRDLRVGASWGDWERDWEADRLGALL